MVRGGLALDSERTKVAWLWSLKGQREGLALDSEGTKVAWPWTQGTKVAWPWTLWGPGILFLFLQLCANL